MVYLISTPKLSCQIKDATGIECPGCGIQRSFELLINGKIIDSIHMYPGLIPLILTFGVLLFHLTKGNLRSLAILKFSIIFTVLVISINYVFKFIPHE